MKQLRTWALVALLAMAGTGMKAQTNLSGRVYHNPNIMTGLLSKGTIDEAKKQVVAEAEKKKGRKLNAAELKKLEEGSKEANAQMQVMAQGTSMAITVEFKSATQAEMKFKMKMSDEAMKMAGMGWVKRQAMKAAMATMPSSETGPYVVKNNLVLFGNEKEGYDTLTISPDGKQLYGFYAFGKDKKPVKYTLKRTK